MSQDSDDHRAEDEASKEYDASFSVGDGDCSSSLVKNLDTENNVNTKAQVLKEERTSIDAPCSKGSRVTDEDSSGGGSERLPERLKPYSRRENANSDIDEADGRATLVAEEEFSPQASSKSPSALEDWFEHTAVESPVGMSSGEDSDVDWDSPIPSDGMSPALHGVHATAVEVARRSFRMLETSGLLNAAAEASPKREDDDDGMEEEERSLSLKAADLQQSLTDVSVGNIDIRGDSGKEPDVHSLIGDELIERESPLKPPNSSVIPSKGRGVQPSSTRDGEDVHHGITATLRYVGITASSSRRLSPGAGEGYSGDPEDEDEEAAEDQQDENALVLRAVVPRPLKEMLRLEATADDPGETPVVRLEHLPPFTEQWTRAALTPYILSQVFSGLAPIASLQGHSEPPCSYMLECCVRPDIGAVTMLHIVSMVASDHGLELVRKRGGQVLYAVAPADEAQERRRSRSDVHAPSPGGAIPLCVNSADGTTGGPGTAFPSSPRERVQFSEASELYSGRGGGGAGWGPWSHVDMQLVVGQVSKHRVLLVRLVTAQPTSCREALRVAESAADTGQPLAIAPTARSFIAAIRSALRERGALLEAIEKEPPGTGRVDVDDSFLGQVEIMCQSDMVASLKEAGVSLDEHARREEMRGVVVTRVLEAIFQMCGLPMLPPPPQLVLAQPRPNDILPTSVASMPELSEEDEAELGDHLFASEASRVMAVVLARCIRFTERCDEQMTARMQRKNRQVMQRISRSQLYQRELLQALRDGHLAVSRTKMASAFHKHVARRADMGIDPFVETPLFYCSILSGRWPGTLYLTYWHICVVLRIPGFTPQVEVMALQEVEAVEKVKGFVGYRVQIRRRKSATIWPPPGPIPPSPSSSPPRDEVRMSGGAMRSQARDSKVFPDVITLATTSVNTGDLRELLEALVRVHREPVTSPRTASRNRSEPRLDGRSL